MSTSFTSFCRFVKSSYTAFVPETSELHTEILQVKAKDTDLNSNISYKIVEPVKGISKAGIPLPYETSIKYKELFRVDNTTGILTVDGRLNYNEAASVSLTIEARDMNAEINKQKQFDLAEVIIYIQPFKNVNPIFIHRDWSPLHPQINVDVHEETSVGSAFLKLDAEDPISQSIITSFELSEPDKGNFVTLNERTGEVSLRQRLDYEALKSNQLIFTVRAITSSGKRSSLAKINATVRNINDNSPLFEKSSYKVTVLESVRYPEAIITIRATDADAVLTKDDERMGYNQITYSLAGTNAVLFTIDNKTGVISVAKGVELDRENKPIIKLTGVAEDSFGKVTVASKTTVNIQIELLDVNDTPPQFDQNLYTTVVPETASVNTLVATLHAKDLDEGPGGEVKYEILNEGDAVGLLQIDPQTGKIHTLLPLTGKGRSDPYEIVIRAQDNGAQIPKMKSLFSDVTFLLYIGDVHQNDGVPYFQQPKIGQMAHISEVRTKVC